MPGYAFAGSRGGPRVDGVGHRSEATDKPRDRSRDRTCPTRSIAVHQSPRKLIHDPRSWRAQNGRARTVKFTSRSRSNREPPLRLSNSSLFAFEAVENHSAIRLSRALKQIGFSTRVVAGGPCPVRRTQRPWPPASSAFWAHHDLRRAPFPSRHPLARRRQTQANGLVLRVGLTPPRSREPHENQTRRISESALRIVSLFAEQPARKAQEEGFFMYRSVVRVTSAVAVSAGLALTGSSASASEVNIRLAVTWQASALRPRPKRRRQPPAPPCRPSPPV